MATRLRNRTFRTDTRANSGCLSATGRLFAPARTPAASPTLKHVGTFRFNAYRQRRDGGLVSATLIFEGQDFWAVATPWEKSKHALFTSEYKPIVDNAGAIVGWLHSDGVHHHPGVLLTLFDIDGHALGEHWNARGLDESMGVELLLMALSIGGGALRAAFSLASQRAVRFELSQVLSVGLKRLRVTMANKLQEQVARRSYVLAEATVFRHWLTADVVSASYAQLERSGAMRLSNGARAVWGDGVYAWKSGFATTEPFVDIEVSAGTAVEEIANQGRIFYRLVPEAGEVLPVKIVGTNLTPEAIAQGRKLIE